MTRGRFPSHDFSEGQMLSQASRWEEGTWEGHRPTSLEFRMVEERVSIRLARAVQSYCCPAVVLNYPTPHSLKCPGLRWHMSWPFCDGQETQASMSILQRGQSHDLLGFCCFIGGVRSIKKIKKTLGSPATSKTFFFVCVWAGLVVRGHWPPFLFGNPEHSVFSICLFVYT